MIRVDDTLTLDESELEFRATTAQGPGGQHVNRSQTRVELLWNVETSPSLDDDQRARIRDRLRTRISKDGVLRVASQRHRSQARNREATVERLVELVAGALRRRRRRKKTRPTRASQRRRVEEKRQRSDVKKLRRKPLRED